MISLCEASQKGLQAELPEKLEADATVDIPMIGLLLEDRGKVLIKKRSEEEKWLKGMWEFPSAEGKNFEEAQKKLEKNLEAAVTLTLLKEVRHQITHHKIKLRFFPARRKSSKPLGPAYKWVTRTELLKYPFASAQNQLRDWVLKNSPPEIKKAPKTKSIRFKLE